MATTTNAVMIVPPMFEVQLFGQGFSSVQISARKVKLLRLDGTGVSTTYNKFDAVEQMSFAELVRFVLERNAKK